MNEKWKRSCAVPECILQFEVKRHFFRFPKEHDRWLQWVRACGRLDLEPKGPEYACRNIRLCHLHFEEKLYKINKMKARLHPDAVPTIFFGPHFKQQDDTNEITQVEVETNISKEKEELHRNVCTEMAIQVEEKNNNAETCEIILPTCHSSTNNLEIEIIKPDTSAEKPGNVTNHTKKLLDDSLRKRKLHQRIKKLEAQNKTLRQIIRQFRMKEKIYKTIYKVIFK